MTSNWLLPRIVELAATYLVHSTLFLLTALVVPPALLRLRRIRRRDPVDSRCEFSPAFTERLWKLAAMLALATGPISVFAGWSRPAWQWSVKPQMNTAQFTSLPEAIDFEAIPCAVPPRIPIPSSEAFEPQVNFDFEEKFGAVSTPRSTQPSTFVPVTVPQMSQTRETVQQSNDIDVVSDLPTSSNGAESLEAISAAADDDTGAIHWGIEVLGTAIVTWCFVSMVRLAITSHLLGRRLAKCPPIEGDLRRELDRIVPRGENIRLLRMASRDNSMGSPEPFACGLFHWTIVLPDGIEQNLSATEMNALLAHEVAHLVRRDPLWLLLFQGISTCLAFQPLNIIARRRWQHTAELLCDDWAIQNQASTLSLASCLTKIAEWRLNRKSASMGLAVVGQSGVLTQRIEWLLRPGRVNEPQQARGRVLTTLLAFVAGLLVGGYGPRFSLITSVEAGEDLEAVMIAAEIDRELDEALQDLARIGSQLPDDAEAVSLVQSIRKRAASLKRD